MATACGTDGGGGWAGGSGGSGRSSTGDSDLSGDQGSGSVGGTAANSGTTSASTVASGGSDDGGSDSGESGGSESGRGMTDCGGLACGPGELCVHPCCGGPAPVCEPADEEGRCADGNPSFPPEQCWFGQGCQADRCCNPAECEPDPPFCAARTEVMCTGNECYVEGCQGSLDDEGNLECLCA